MAISSSSRSSRSRSSTRAASARALSGRAAPRSSKPKRARPKDTFEVGASRERPFKGNEPASKSTGAKQSGPAAKALARGGGGVAKAGLPVEAKLPRGSQFKLAGLDEHRGVSSFDCDTAPLGQASGPVCRDKGGDKTSQEGTTGAENNLSPPLPPSSGELPHAEVDFA